MTDNLPAEIATNIAIHLSRYRLCACVLVCHSWYSAFSTTLYSTVEIRDGRQFNQFIRALRRTGKLNPVGQLVRTLKLSRNDTSYIDFSVLKPLPLLCPFLHELDYEAKWVPELSRILQKWKHLKTIRSGPIRSPQPLPVEFLRDRLTRITICIDSHIPWLKLMTGLPCIEELSLEHAALNRHDSGAVVSLDELEAMHDAAPRLHTFKIVDIEIYGEMPKHITPLHNLRDLTLNKVEGSLWGLYFAQKYKYLKKLNLIYAKKMDRHQRAETMFLARSCRYLERFQFDSHCYINDNSKHSAEMCQHIYSPITDIELYKPHRDQYANAVGRFYKTLSCVSLSLQSMGFEQVIEPLKACLLLVELRLHGELDVEMNRILDYWKRLKHLGVTVRNTCVSSDYTAHDQHSLSTLQIDGHVEKDVFRYLSQRCIHLSSVTVKFGSLPQPYVVYLPNPGIRNLSVSSEGNKHIYKVTQTAKGEPNQDWDTASQSFTGDHEIDSGSRWFCTNSYNSSISELTCHEIDVLSISLCKSCDKCDEKDSGKSSKNEKLSIMRNGTHIMWILCHEVGELFLAGGRVHSL